ncbi:MAG: carboxypeptidase regulatory-like domain-containing protein, partial [Acidobacteriaceae bacterium]|nr:carboxypeptidase regulatory-like domain-containing protein [Acidobacteriaceae bacterium]
MRLFRIALAAAAFLWPTWLAAQYTSSIEGIVTDRSGATVPDAQVNITNVAAGIVRHTVTTGDGFYRVIDLVPGKYDVAVDHPGFRTAEQHGVNLAGSETVRVNVALELGAISEKVSVQAEVPQVETEEGRISGNITTQDLQELPLNGRNIYNVVALEPGVSGRGLASTFGSGGGGTNNDSFAAENHPEMYASGQRVESNSYLLDGMS